MRHAVLGAGGVGGFVGALLAEAGHEVTLLVRPGAAAGYPDRLLLESPLGRFAPPVRHAVALAEAVDVLWVTVKATQLPAALGAVPDPGRAATVVPLLNGLDHVALLRERFGDDRVVPATIGIEVERVAPGRFVHRSPFAVLRWAASDATRLAAVADALGALGCRCELAEDEATLLWQKLVMLGPLALCTTAADRDLGGVRDDARWRAALEAAVREACDAAVADGARVDVEDTLALVLRMPPGLRSSMQKDVAAGRPPEVDAIGGAILRRAARHGIPAPTTAALVDAVRARASAPGSEPGSEPRSGPT
jgi:2-dehydropantoate 2-reductase